MIQTAKSLFKSLAYNYFIIYYLKVILAYFDTFEVRVHNLEPQKMWP